MTAEELFAAALDKPAAERAAFLDRACAGDADLRGRVADLLRAHEQADNSLEGTPADAGPTSDLEGGRWISSPAELGTSSQREGPGTHIGPYKLLQQLGEGGMGTVWMAEQEQPVRRQAALKIIKAGLDSDQVVARFEQERQALALMDHPHIAKVLDAGATETGRPFFVMELVQGMPLTKYCDQQHLTPRERLELFVLVCQAVQHAHQKGIIHRDLKPSNVLVALYDGQPVPKVIDFGIAKATGQKLTERTLFTEVGQLIGTLEYMAPEQAELNNLDIDTRADIYALGVILYELLTGSTPFTRQQLRSVAFTEMLRLIREVEPPRPSTRLSSSVQLPSLAAQRQLEPRRLTRLVQGDLDWIVMKCLEKDRGRRYETANGLALELQRYLADEPVLASPPGAGYQLSKFLRRNKGPVGAAALVLLTLLAGIVGTSWGLVEARQQRDVAVVQKERAENAEAVANDRLVEVTQQKQRAEAAEGLAKEEAAIARAVNEFLQQDLLGQADPANQAGSETGRDKDVKVRTLLDRTAKSIEGKFKDQPLTEAAIRLTLGNTYRALGSYPEAQLQLERSVQLYRERLGEDHLDTLAGKNSLALLYQSQAKFDQAEPLLREVLALRTSKLGADHPDTLLSKLSLAGLYREQTHYDRSETLYQEVLAGLRAQLGADHPYTLATKHNLAVLYLAQGKLDQAQPLLQEALDGRTARLGADHPHTLLSKFYLAELYRYRKDLDRAEQLHKEVLADRTATLGADHLSVLQSKNTLAVAYANHGKLDQAEPLYKEALAGRRAKLGPDHPDTLRTTNNLAILYYRQKAYDRAEPLFQAMLQARTAKLGANHHETLLSKHNLAGLYLAQEKYDLAEKLLNEALAGFFTLKLPADHRDILNTKRMLVECYERMGQKDKADEWRKQLEQAKAAKPPAQP
jgi:serine/threonine protein kinase/tetratricopeptide (TPR) repeat protein